MVFVHQYKPVLEETPFKAPTYGQDTHISDGRSVDGSDHEDVVAKTRRRVREVKERERLEPPA